jgi:hypothetical protein
LHGGAKRFNLLLLLRDGRLCGDCALLFCDVPVLARLRGAGKIPLFPPFFKMKRFAMRKRIEFASLPALDIFVYYAIPNCY